LGTKGFGGLIMARIACISRRRAAVFETVLWHIGPQELESYVSKLIANFKMQLKIKWVEINKPNLLSHRMPPYVTLVTRPLTGACDVMFMTSCMDWKVRAKRKDGKLFPQYITDTL
jgi:hypothetical protein